MRTHVLNATFVAGRKFLVDFPKIYLLKKSEPMKQSEFIVKLQTMIESHPQTIGWGENGEDLVIKDLQKLNKTILPIYFKHSNVNSFLRQLNMYGFFREQNERGYLAFKHDIFRPGNQEKFCRIQRASKNRTLKNAGDQFNKRRANFQTAFKSENHLDQTSKNIFLDLLLFKDQTEKITRQIKQYTKYLLMELSDSRASQVIGRSEQILNQSLVPIGHSLKKAREIDTVAQIYLEAKGNDLALKEQQEQNCSLDDGIKEALDQIQEPDSIEFSQNTEERQIRSFEHQ